MQDYLLVFTNLRQQSGIMSIEGGVTNASPGCEDKSLKTGYLPTILPSERRPIKRHENGC